MEDGRLLAISVYELVEEYNDGPVGKAEVNGREVKKLSEWVILGYAVVVEDISPTSVEGV